MPGEAFDCRLLCHSRGDRLPRPASGQQIGCPYGAWQISYGLLFHQLDGGTGIRPGSHPAWPCRARHRVLHLPYYLYSFKPDFTCAHRSWRTSSRGGEVLAVSARVGVKHWLFVALEPAQDESRSQPRVPQLRWHQCCTPGSDAGSLPAAAQGTLLLTPGLLHPLDGSPKPLRLSAALNFARNQQVFLPS